MRVQKFFSKPSLTQQNFRDSCNINKIIKRYASQTGVDPMSLDPNSFGGLYGDFTDVPVLRDALDKVKQAEVFFDALPWKIRDMFGHSVVKLTEFCQDPANESKLVDLGLIPKGPPVQDVASQAPFSPGVNEEKVS